MLLPLWVYSADPCDSAIPVDDVDAFESEGVAWDSDRFSISDNVPREGLVSGDADHTPFEEI